MAEADRQRKPNLFRTIGRVALIRLILFFMVLVAAYGGVQIALMEIAKKIPKHSAEVLALGGVVVSSAVLIGVYVLLVRWIERRKARELAPARAFPLAIGGAVFGFVIFCIVYAIFWAMGVARWQGVSFSGAVIPALSMGILSGVGEELAFRGGVFRILEDSFGTAVALLLSAGLFGLMHAANRGATTVSTVAIALEAGVLLGAAYAVSRNLWLPIGLHFGWNFTEGGVFGAAVSGGGFGKGLIHMPLSGRDLLTGGVFGPEASLVAVAVCLAAAIILIAVTIRRGRWMPLSFRMMLD